MFGTVAAPLTVTSYALATISLFSLYFTAVPLVTVLHSHFTWFSVTAPNWKLTCWLITTYTLCRYVTNPWRKIWYVRGRPRSFSSVDRFPGHSRRYERRAQDMRRNITSHSFLNNMFYSHYTFSTYSIGFIIIVKDFRWWQLLTGSRLILVIFWIISSL
jgi:hypothetical protein